MISRETILRGFPIKPLGEVAEFLDSRRRPITASERIPGPYPYYGANGQQDSVADYIFDEPLILLAEDGGPFDQPDRGIAYAIEGKTWVNNHAHVLRPRDHARLRYLVRVLENYDVTPWITGSTRAKLTKAGAFKIQIPLPPLAEQRRIAEILDKADALRAKRREALAQLDTVTQSIFLDMFGDPATNPKGWPTNALEDLFEISRGGSPRPIDDYITESPDGVNWIMIGDAPEGSKYITATKKKIKPEGAKRSRSVKPGDFLLTNSMSFGRPYIMRTSGCIHDGWLVLSPRKSNVVPDYFYSLLGSRALYTEFSRRAPGATVKNLNIGLVRSVVVPVPPEAKQREYADRVSAIEGLTVPFQRSLDALEGLFASLQQRAFRGEL